MPKIKNLHSDIKLIKRKKSKFHGLKLTLFLASCLLLIVFVADIFSGLITLGEFGFLNIFKKDDFHILINAHTLYSVNMDSASNYNDAENLASFLSMQGAAAFIWEENSNFYIVGNIYKKSDDAKKVKDNLVTTNPECFITEINFNKVSLKLDKYSKEQVKVVENALNFITHITDSLYDYLIKLDKKEILSSTASSYVNTLKSDAKIIALNIDVINSTYVYESGIKIKNAYVKIIDVLDELVLKLINSQAFNHLIKFSYANIVKIKYDLFNNL